MKDILALTAIETLTSEIKRLRHVSKGDKVRVGSYQRYQKELQQKIDTLTADNMRLEEEIEELNSKVVQSPSVSSVLGYEPPFNLGDVVKINYPNTMMEHVYNGTFVKLVAYNHIKKSYRATIETMGSDKKLRNSFDIEPAHLLPLTDSELNPLVETNNQPFKPGDIVKVDAPSGKANALLNGEFAIFTDYFTHRPDACNTVLITGEHFTKKWQFNTSHLVKATDEEIDQLKNKKL